MPHELNPEEKQSLRYILRDALAVRHPVAMSVKQLTNRAAMETPFKVTEENVRAALEFLCESESKPARRIDSEFGAVPCYQATAAGVIAWEREAGVKVFSTTKTKGMK